MSSNSHGKLIGIGVGPGAPDLLTVRATRLIAHADVIAYPSAEGKDSRSLAIIQDWLADDTLLLPFEIDMTPRAGAARPAYDAIAPQIEEHCRAGRDVLVLCEGDPLLYGSFIALLDRLGDRIETEVVPGITSALAAAAQTNTPLATKNAPFRILPATMTQEQLTLDLKGKGAAVIIKPRRHDRKIIDALKETGRFDPALLVTEASSPASTARPLSDVTDALPYFSLILCPDSERNDN